MPDKPNVLLIMTDQQRADTLGVYGSDLGATPNIDALAESGVTFRRAYCNNPLCMPSRAAVLTGRYPSSSGVRTNGCVARAGQRLLPEVLSEAGYRTAAFGKVHYHPAGGEPQGYWPENRKLIERGEDLTRPYLGFQKIALGCGHQDVMPGLHERELRERAPELLEKRGPKGTSLAPDPLLQFAQKIETYQSTTPVEHYPTTWVIDRTVDYIRNAEEPFFVWCGINDPHHSFNPPGHYWGRFSSDDMPGPMRREGELGDKPPHFRGFYEGKYREIDTDGFLLGSEPYLTDERVRTMQAAYYGMVAMLDDGVGRLMAVLQERGLRENTVVIFTSDHGEYLGDHGFVLKGPMHYENLLRVPLVCHWPGRIPAGQVLDSPVGLIDLFPTITALCSAEGPEGVQGNSLLGQLRDGAPGKADHVYIENDVDRLGLRLRTLVTDRWKLTWYAGEDYGEIYDLEEDPNEFVNLWDKCDGRLRQELVERLLEAVVCNHDTLPPKLSHA